MFRLKFIAFWGSFLRSGHFTDEMPSMPKKPRTPSSKVWTNCTQKSKDCPHYNQNGKTSFPSVSSGHRFWKAFRKRLSIHIDNLWHRCLPSIFYRFLIRFWTHFGRLWGVQIGHFWHRFLKEFGMSFQQRPKSSQERSKSGQGRHKSGQERHKKDQKRHKSCQERLKSFQEQP